MSAVSRIGFAHLILAAGQRRTQLRPDPPLASPQPDPRPRRLHRRPSHRRRRTHHPRQLPPIHRLFTQVDRIMKINGLRTITLEVIEAARATLPVIRAVNFEHRHPARGGQRLPDVVLRRTGRVAVPDRQGQGGHPVSHRPVPAGAPSGQGAHRADPGCAQARLGLGRAAPHRESRGRTGGAGADRVRPRVHPPPVARHPARFPQGGRSHPGLRRENFRPCHQTRPSRWPGRCGSRVSRSPSWSTRQAAGPRPGTGDAGRAAQGRRHRPGVPDRGASGLP